jgi:Domain of unknown function (DUF4440)
MMGWAEPAHPGTGGTPAHPRRYNPPMSDDGGRIDKVELARLNHELVDAERRGAGGVEFFERLLDERCVVRRGDGTLVDRSCFIEALGDPRNSSDELTTEICQVQVFGDQAFVEALVRLRGRRRGNEVDGTFRNLRFFERRDGEWRLVMWFNKRLPASES